MRPQIRQIILPPGQNLPPQFLQQNLPPNIIHNVIPGNLIQPPNIVQHSRVSAPNMQNLSYNSSVRSTPVASLHEAPFSINE